MVVGIGMFPLVLKLFLGPFKYLERFVGFVKASDKKKQDIKKKKFKQKSKNHRICLLIFQSFELDIWSQSDIKTKIVKGKMSFF